MNTVVPELAIRRHDAYGLHEQRQDVLSVYSEANADRLDDPFYSPSHYWERLEAYAARKGFGLVTGRLGAELVGYALGYPLHDALLRDKPEARATLLVRPDNTAAHHAYRSWGWYKIGELQPCDDAPIFDAMVLDRHSVESTRLIDRQAAPVAGDCMVRTEWSSSPAVRLTVADTLAGRGRGMAQDQTLGRYVAIVRLP